MKYLLPLLFCCLVADAQSFKVYELLIAKDKIESFSSPQKMIEAAGHDGVTMTAYADLPKGKNGVWSLDQTHIVRYAEEVNAQGQSTKFADRKVGIEIRLELQEDGRFDVSYSNTRLVAWIPFSEHAGVFQPILTTTQLTPGPIYLDGYTAMGGLVNPDGVLQIIIQKIQ